VAARFFNPTPQLFTDANKVLAGGFINFWANGTTNNQDTFPIVELTGDPNPNPVPLDSSGRPTVDIFAAEASVFSVRVIDSASQVIVPTVDDVSFVRENVISAADVVAALTANAAAGVYNGTQMTGTAFANFASNLDLTAAGSIDTTLGALTVGDVTFNSAISIDDTTESTSTTTGSIQTDGGLGVVKALFVGGASTLTGKINISNAGVGAATVNNTAQFGVAAAAGLQLIGHGDNFDITILNQAAVTVLTVTQNSTTVNLAGILSVDDTTESTSTITGSIHTDGGLGVAKDIQVGGDIVMASGKGIDFSATADGSGTTTSERFNFYEEGTFTPVLEDLSSSDATYTLQVGRYTKMGREVHYHIALTLATLGTLSGGVKITGLPFTSSSAINGGGVCTFGASLAIAVGTVITGSVPISSTQLSLDLWDDAGGTTDLQASEITANGLIKFSGIYEAA